MHKVLTDYFRCPDIPGDFSVPGGLSEKPGYFSLGPEIVCYGRASGGVAPTPTPSNGHLHDVFGNAQLNGPLNQLPFDPAEVIIIFVMNVTSLQAARAIRDEFGE